MEPIAGAREIIDYCLKPLDLNPMNPATQETRRRLEHAIRAYQRMAAKPVAVDFSTMPTAVINEAAHGYEDA